MSNVSKYSHINIARKCDFNKYKSGSGLKIKLHESGLEIKLHESGVNMKVD
jgi:hypothetical protein